MEVTYLLRISEGSQGSKGRKEKPFMLSLVPIIIIMKHYNSWAQENAQVHTAASGEKGNHLFLIISILTKAVFRMPTSINT